MNRVLLYVLYHLPIKNRAYFKKLYKQKRRNVFSGKTIIDDLTSEDLEEHKKFVIKSKNHIWQCTPKSILCFMQFLPDFLAGGCKTHLDLMYYLKKKWGAKIYVFFAPEISNDKLHIFKNNIDKYYREFDIIYLDKEELKKIKVDISLALGDESIIQSVKFNNCEEKYQHRMDYSPYFEPSGTDTSISEFLYSLGLYKIVNSNELSRIFKFHNPRDVVYRYFPGINHKIYYPPKDKVYQKDVYKIIFYARPSFSRNMFSLLIPTLKLIKKQLNDKVQIIAIGEEFLPSDYGLENVVENYGKFNSLEKLAELYRECDLGISLISTPTFSYQHLEFMASGTCLVTNEQPGIADFLVDGENAVVSPPVPQILAEKVINVLKSPSKLEHISKGGVSFSDSLSWDNCFEGISNFIINKKQ